MSKGNAVYAQSGGVTSVINASAYGVISAAREADFVENIYGGYDGINGVLEEKLIDFSKEPSENIEGLKSTPAAGLGSCRRKLTDLEKNRKEFERIVEVFEAHSVRFFFYNGGNDSMDTAHKISQLSHELGYDVSCVGVPKTVDNDLPITDNCPGFGSVAKYVAVSAMEGSYDVASMCRDSTKVFVLETMGRHAGWIAAAGGLASKAPKDGPHLILLPEVPLNKETFMAKVQDTVGEHGYCSIVVSEGAKYENGDFIADMGTTDAFGHKQLGGAGTAVTSLVLEADSKLKTHCAILDYCQRSGRHLASKTDWEQAIAVGREAVRLAGEGLNGQMVTIVRESDAPYSWTLGHTDIANIANVEKTLPQEYIRDDGFHITDAFRTYCQPLIEGEIFPEFEGGLPKYVQLKRELIEPKCAPFEG